MSVEIVRDLGKRDGKNGASQVLVKQGEHFFVVSSCDVVFSGFETLVFPANAKGDITDWTEVAGGKGMSREEAIEDLASRSRDTHGDTA